MKLIYKKAFKEDKKRLERRGYNLNLLGEVIDYLINKKQLPEKYRDHSLKHSGLRDCHIKPDWVLLYKLDIENDVLYLYRTGTHSDLEL